MNRIYHNYKKWEDFQNGMFKVQDKSIEHTARMNALTLLSTPDDLFLAMSKVTEEWICATEVNLTNKSRNRRAWLGQSACCYAHGATEDTTKEAWRLLTEEERIEANRIADIVIKNWERCQKRN